MISALPNSRWVSRGKSANSSLVNRPYRLKRLRLSQVIAPKATVLEWSPPYVLVGRFPFLL